MSKSEMTRLFDEASAMNGAEISASDSDLDRYRPYLAHLDISEVRKTETLIAVRRMMQSFVNRAFGDDPVQRSGCLEDKRHAKDEIPALPVIDFYSENDLDEAKKLSDASHNHVAGANKEEKR